MSAPLLLNLLSLASSAYIIRAIGGEGWGVWVTAQALVGSGTFLANLGLRGIFIRSLAVESSKAQQLLSEQLTLRLALGLVAITAAIAITIAFRYPVTVLWCVLIAGATALMTIVWTTLGDFLHAFRRFRAFAITSLIAGLILTVASVVAAWLGLGPVGIAAAYATGPLMTALAMKVALGRAGYHLRLSWNPTRFRALLKASSGLAGQQFISSMQSRLASLMLPKLIGIAPYGHLSAAGMPADRLSIIPDSFNSVFFPSLSRAHGRGSLDEFRKESERFLNHVLVLTIAPILAVIFLAGPIAELLVPEATDLGRLAVITSSIGMVLGAFGLALGQIVQARGQFNRFAAASVTSTLLQVPLLIGVIIRFGVIGAAALLAIRPIISVGAMLWAVHEPEDALVSRLPWVTVGVSLALASAAGLALQQAVSAGLVGAMLAAMAATGVFLVIVLVRRVIDISWAWHLIWPARK